MPKSPGSLEGRELTLTARELLGNRLVQPLKIDGASVRTAGPSQRISTDGGREPNGSSDSRELFCREGQNFLVVISESKAAFQPSPPKRMFSGAFEARWGVDADSEHFVLIERAPEYPRLRAFAYVEHWVEDVRRKLGMTRETP